MHDVLLASFPVLGRGWQIFQVDYEVLRPVLQVLLRREPVGVRFFVGTTDRDWFDFLSGLNGLDEVNFWQPSGQQQFRALQIGEPFLFKLQCPSGEPA
ncbi:MAG TPA: hypothetical protein VII95_03185 [Terriglobales bacterium]